MCGVFGIFGHPEAANITYLGLHALQHRGQESAGIASSNGDRLFAHRAMGKVKDAFSEADLAMLQGPFAIGHVRYSTAGGSHLRNAQPIAVDYVHGSVALGHNGNLTNHEALRAELETQGSIFQSSSDTETIVHLIARSQKATIEERVIDALKHVQGAYSLLLLTEKQLIAVRDPSGIRPLVLGSMQRDARKFPVIASEPTSFDLIGAEFVRDVAPGELVIVEESGVRSLFPFEARPPAMCLFEYVYFARPDATLDGANVYQVRKELGRQLALEHPLPNPATDGIVIPVPDSGLPAAIGFAEASGLPFEMGLIRSHYVGRTFIEPQDTIRHFGVRLKLSPNRGVLRDKRVIVVDDSIVRGTTSRKIVKMLREAGAKEVHVRVSSPPTQWPCHYGIDTPTREELLAPNYDQAGIADYLGANTVGYLSLASLQQSVTKTRGLPTQTGGYCHACFSGQYPVPISQKHAGKLTVMRGGGS